MKEIALHILDITQNSIRAGADEIRITLSESLSTNTLTLCIADNGRGMDQEMCAKATDPYFTSRTTRRVGMGLPLLQMNARLSGGEMTISSVPEQGTSVTATFGYNNIDRPPLGDVGGTIALIILSNPDTNVIYTHICGESEWRISTYEIKEQLGEEAVKDLSIVRYIREIIYENAADLRNNKAEYDKY